MPSPISPTGCASRPPRAGRRPRRCAALRARRPPATGDGGRLIVEGAPVSTGRDARVTEAGDYRFFAGWRSDPFFFDVRGRPEQLAVHRRRFLRRQGRVQHRAGSAQLSPGAERGWPLGPHADRTARAGSWVQADRGARPTQTPFLSRRAERRLPRRGAGGRCPFRRRLRARARACGGYTPEEASGWQRHCCRTSCTTTPRAGRPSRTTAGRYRRRLRCLPGYPHKWEGDEDKVGPHGDLLADFPYLGPPRSSR